MSGSKQTAPRLRLPAAALLVLALGFGGGFLTGHDHESAEALPGVSTASNPPRSEEIGTAALLNEAARTDNAGLSTLLARHAGERALRDQLVLLLAEKNPHQALAFLLNAWTTDKDPTLLTLFGSLFRAWAAKSPEEAIAAVETLSDPALRSEAVAGTLDSLFDADPDHARTLLVEWQHDMQGEFPFPDWFDANPEEGAALLAEMGTSFLGYKMKWEIPLRWAKSDPLAALTWMASHPESATADVIPSVVRAWVKADLPAAEAALQGGKFTDPKMIDALSEAIISARAQENPAAALAWTTTHLQGELLEKTLRTTVKAWSQQDLPAATAWALAQTDSETERIAIPTLTEEWSRTDASDAAEFALAHLEPTLGFNDAPFLCSIGEHYIQSDPGAALDWADKLPDSIRYRVEDSMLEHLFHQNPESAASEAAQRLDRFSRHTVEKFSRNYFMANPVAAKQWLTSLPESESAAFVRSGLRTAARGSSNETLKAMAAELAPALD